MTAAEEFQEINVAKDLQLLADFVSDVKILRVQVRKVVSAGVYVSQGELGAVK